MTRTYDDLRGYRGYSAIATHTRARTRTHAREICSGLKITPHNPANPANQGKADGQHDPVAPKTGDTVLRHCRCIDCRKFYRQDGTYFCAAGIGGTLITWGTGERAYNPAPDKWHYCAGYAGPAISPSVWVWPSDTLAPRGESHEPSGAGREPSVQGTGAGVRAVPSGTRECGNGTDAGGNGATGSRTAASPCPLSAPAPGKAADATAGRRVSRRQTLNPRRMAVHAPLFASVGEGRALGSVSPGGSGTVAGRPNAGQTSGVTADQARHVGAGSNISSQAEQGYGRARDCDVGAGCQTGQGGQDLHSPGQGMVPSGETVAEDRGGNGRERSFCLLPT